MQLTTSDLSYLAGVHPDLQKVIKRAAQLTTIPFKLTEGLRTVARQRQLVKQGASKTMNSRHLDGHAVDLVPVVDVNGDGKISASEMYSWPLYFKLAPIIKQAAKEVGVSIEWGGDWKSFKDGPHWQLPFSKYPKARALGLLGAASGIDSDEVVDSPEYTDQTDNEAHAKTIATVAGGTGAGASMSYQPVVDIVNALTYQQGEITSGQIIRVVIGAVIIGITVWMAWKQWKAEQ